MSAMQYSHRNRVLSVVGSRRGLYVFPTSSHVASDAVSTPHVENPRYDIGDLAELIISHMPTPSLVSLQSPRSDDAVSAARDLFNVMRASSSFFYPAAEALWSNCTDINNLLWVLYGGLGWDKAAVGLQEAEHDFEKDIVTHLCSMEMSELDRLPGMRNLRFYASCIKALRVSSARAPSALLEYIASILPGGTLLPHLQELSWFEDRPYVTPLEISTFLGSPHLRAVRMTFRDRLGAAEIPERRSFFGDSVVSACISVSIGAPNLRELTIISPSGISIPASTMKLFQNLQWANIQVTLIPGAILDPRTPLWLYSTSILEDNSQFPVVRYELPPLECLEKFKLLWGLETRATDIVSVMKLDKLQHLTIHTNRRLGRQFISDMTYLTSNTSANLRTVEIVSYRRPSHSTVIGSFVEAFGPLLHRHGLQEVRIELQPYNFSLCASDLTRLSTAWPLLEKLHISFKLRHGDIMPTLHYALINFSRSCAQLRYLHLPGIATGIRLDPTQMVFPSFPASKLEHVSSDYLQCTHSTFDIAAALYTAFPRLSQAGPRFQRPHSKWANVNLFLQMIRRSSSLAAVHEAITALALTGDRQMSVFLYRMALYDGALPRSSRICIRAFDLVDFTCPLSDIVCNSYQGIGGHISRCAAILVSRPVAKEHIELTRCIMRRVPSTSGECLISQDHLSSHAQTKNSEPVPGGPSAVASDTALSKISITLQHNPPLRPSLVRLRRWITSTASSPPAYTSPTAPSHIGPCSFSPQPDVAPTSSTPPMLASPFCHRDDDRDETSESITLAVSDMSLRRDHSPMFAFDDPVHYNPMTSDSDETIFGIQLDDALTHERKSPLSWDAHYANFTTHTRRFDSTFSNSSSNYYTPSTLEFSESALYSNWITDPDASRTTANPSVFPDVTPYSPTTANAALQPFPLSPPDNAMMADQVRTELSGTVSSPANLFADAGAPSWASRLWAAQSTLPSPGVPVPIRPLSTEDNFATQRQWVPVRRGTPVTQLFQSSSAPSPSHARPPCIHSRPYSTRRSESISEHDDRDATVRRKKRPMEEGEVQPRVKRSESPISSPRIDASTAQTRAIGVAAAAREDGQEYAKLSPEEKEPYRRRSQKAKEEREELKAYMRTLTPDDIKRENAYRTAQCKAGKSRKGNLKGPNAPKKPLSAYFMFLRRIRSDPELVEEVFGDETETTKQSVLAAGKWRSMTDEQHKPFLAQAEREKLEYEAARKAYEEGQDASIGFGTSMNFSILPGGPINLMPIPRNTPHPLKEEAPSSESESDDFMTDDGAEHTSASPRRR
ncbi:hypothetical protein ONZ51_g6527 [Trametes cubensis]|uniref:HMG box domain-containing protein n=1 Tax=Trametes cubensis TaxID=1111947 RepID=A0AAD7TS14_9APHY|nr:hypothetical protein ONZ51_g6527 [Trametes cubensis]